MAERIQPLIRAAWLLLLAASVQIGAHESTPRLGDGGSAVAAEINGPVSVAVNDYSLYIAEGFRNVIRCVDLKTGIITTVKINDPLEAIGHIALDHSGGLLVVEFTLDRIRKIDLTSGSVTTIVGSQRLSFSGDGGLASLAGLRGPHYVTLDSNGNLFIVDMGNNRIRKVDRISGLITTVAGNGEQKTSGDGGPAVQAGLEYPNSVVVDKEGNLFISQSGYTSSSHRIRRVDSKSGIIETIAGLGGEGVPVHGSPAQKAPLQSPSDLLLDLSNNFLFVDPVNDLVFRIDARSWTIQKLAGTVKGFKGDGGPASSACLNNPSGLALDARGNLYIAEFVNNRVRRVDGRTGVIKTIAGSGLPRRIDTHP
jgi:DNA-binding beta-propeller fold protein YncE